MKVNELNIKDLMVGDWAEVPFLEGKPKIVKVEEILSDEINPMWDGMENYGGIKIKYVKPIPLTPEILEKNGFEYMNDEYGCWVMDRVELLEREPYNGLFEVEIRISGETVLLHYVHELQHALKLCGIEKNIII